jgi:hypothetical protein
MGEDCGQGDALIVRRSRLPVGVEPHAQPPGPRSPVQAEREPVGADARVFTAR